MHISNWEAAQDDPNFAAARKIIQVFDSLLYSNQEGFLFSELDKLQANNPDNFSDVLAFLKQEPTYKDIHKYISNWEQSRRA